MIYGKSISRVLTRASCFFIKKTHELENRLEYYEEVFITLLTALKKGGIIIDDSEGHHSMP